MLEFARIWQDKPKIVLSTSLMYVHPVILGAGAPFFPPLEDRTALKLVETRTFGSGVIYIRYEAKPR